MKVPKGYRVEKWPWGGYTAYKKAYDELWVVDDTRGNTRYQSLKKLKEKLEIK